MAKNKNNEAEAEAMAILIDAIFSESKPKRKLTVNAANLGKVSGASDDYIRFWQGMSEQLVSVSEAAKLRGISRISMYDLVERGRLHTVEFGGKKFLIRKEVEDFAPQRPGPKATGNG